MLKQYVMLNWSFQGSTIPVTYIILLTLLISDPVFSWLFTVVAELLPQVKIFLHRQKSLKTRKYFGLY